MSLKEGKKYNPDFLETDRSLLLDFYHALGYLGLAVEEFRTDYSGDTQTTDIHIVVHEGPQTTIGRIDVTGMNTVPERENKESAQYPLRGCVQRGRYLRRTLAG